MHDTNDRIRGDYPAWMPTLMAIPPLFFAALSVWGAGTAWPVVATAVAVAVLPWLLRAGGVGLPAWAFATWVLAPIAVVNLGGGALGVDLSGESHTQFTLMILVWLAGEMAATAAPKVVAATAAGALAVMAGRAVVEPAFGHSWTFWAGGGGIALLTGYLLRRQQATLSELRRAQAALADEAVQRERQRIAREVHDVVAHTMTVTLMHLQAARRALGTDPGGAGEALEEAEALARRSLSDIRRTVGLLRADGDAPETRALPDARDLPGLLESYRTAGVVLSADLDADMDGLDPAVGLTLYRLVQEALANAASHAGGAAVDLSVRAVDGELRVDVANPLPPGQGATTGGGLGLVGMRERIRLLGGTLQAGPDGDGWRIRARLPVRTPAPSTTEPSL